jgi:hypothetical protein
LYNISPWLKTLALKPIKEANARGSQDWLEMAVGRKPEGN